MKRRGGVLAACLAVLLVACEGEPTAFREGFEGPPESLAADRYPSDVPVAWYNLLYKLVQAERLTPPVASRVYGYAGVALYEAVVPGMRGYRSLSAELQGLPLVPFAERPATHWPASANRALAVVFADLFADGGPGTRAAIASLYRTLHTRLEAEVPGNVLAHSEERGERVGRAIAEWASADGHREWRGCPFIPPLGQGDGVWVPTAPGFGPPVEPCWGRIRPFVVRRLSECDPGPHPAYSEEPGSDFYREGLEVYDVVQSLTDEERTIAVFWADDPGVTGTPSGHTVAVLSQILVQQGSRLDLASEAYAKVGMALADAFISCWRNKYEYNLLRPVTYIQRLLHPGWVTPIATPSFPEYTSGHSVQAGASAEVLTDLFGDIPFVDHTHDALGYAPRPFATFDEWALESAISRLYGGVHFRSAIDLGVAQGRCVGRRVNALKIADRGTRVARRAGAVR